MKSEFDDKHNDSVLKLFLRYRVLDIDIYNCKEISSQDCLQFIWNLQNLKSFQFILHCHQYVVSTEYIWCLKVLNCCNRGT